MFYGAGSKAYGWGLQIEIIAAVRVLSILDAISTSFIIKISSSIFHLVADDANTRLHTPTA